MLRLSIIVPVYNTEQFLRKCLSSILNQEIDKSLYEVIIVNDGSPDNSQTIIDEYCAKYENVSCIKQSNQGLSMARNHGVDKARGEYVWFVDSDDWVKADSISRILAECYYLPDAIAITYMKDGVGNEYSPSYSTTGFKILQSRNFVRGMVFYILRQEFIQRHKLSICPGIYHEDAEFTPRMLYFAKSIRVITEPLYYMYFNPESITRSINPKRSYDLLTVSDNLSKFKKNIVEASIQQVFDYLISVNLNSALSNIITSDNVERKRFNKALYEKRYLISSLWNSTLKYRVEYILFKIFPKNYVGIYRMMKRK